MRQPGRIWIVLLLLFIAGASPLAAEESEESIAPEETAALEQPADQPVPTEGMPPLEVDAPGVSPSGRPVTITIKATGALPADPLPVEVYEESGYLVIVSGTVSASGEITFELPAASPGRSFYWVASPEYYNLGMPLTIRTIPGWSTLLPAVSAILLALAFRQVVPALLFGIWIGAWVIHDGPLTGLLRTIDGYVSQSLANDNNASIILFTLLLGGMVGVISRSGGTLGLVEVLAPRATNSRRGQIVTWLMGFVVFFDDYANTLLVGNTMRPVTDRLRISREKLAYIVDSTAAPVASLALVSTWIGYEISLIGNSLDALGSERDPYSVFLQSLPYNFYPILALVFGLLVASSLRDFGPMLKAERRAAGGKLFSDTAMPLGDFDAAALAPLEGKPRRWINAVIPVVLVLIVTFVSLWYTGRQALAGDPLGTAAFSELGAEGVRSVFASADAFKSLLYGSFVGSLSALLLALVQRILTLGEGMVAWVNGMKSLMTAMVILILAWSIGSVCADMGTANFLVGALSDALDPRILPALIFVLAAVTAFATGTSWATMAILLPLAVPSAVGVAQAAGFDPAAAHRILLGSISAVLAGALFGDHCSPISDTTVMSSMSSGCDHVDHVRTQLPYALLVGGVAIVLGYIPAGFGVSPLLCLVAASLALFVLLRWFGRPAAA